MSRNTIRLVMAFAVGMLIGVVIVLAWSSSRARVPAWMRDLDQLLVSDDDGAFARRANLVIARRDHVVEMLRNVRMLTPHQALALVFLLEELAPLKPDMRYLHVADVLDSDFDELAHSALHFLCQHYPYDRVRLRLLRAADSPCIPSRVLERVVYVLGDKLPEGVAHDDPAYQIVLESWSNEHLPVRARLYALRVLAEHGFDVTTSHLELLLQAEPALQGEPLFEDVRRYVVEKED